jgi:hypothetical protein
MPHQLFSLLNTSNSLFSLFWYLSLPSNAHLCGHVFFFFFFRYNLLTSPFGKRGFNVFLPLRPGNVAHSCNHSTQEARHENCKFETSLGYNSKTAQKKKSYPLTSSFSHNVPHSSFHHSSVGALVRLACSMLYYYIYIRLF